MDTLFNCLIPLLHHDNLCCFALHRAIEQNSVHYPRSNNERNPTSIANEQCENAYSDCKRPVHNKTTDKHNYSGGCLTCHQPANTIDAEKDVKQHFHYDSRATIRSSVVRNGYIYTILHVWLPIIRLLIVPLLRRYIALLWIIARLRWRHIPLLIITGLRLRRSTQGR